MKNNAEEIACIILQKTPRIISEMISHNLQTFGAQYHYPYFKTIFRLYSSPAVGSSVAISMYTDPEKVTANHYRSSCIEGNIKFST